MYLFIPNHPRPNTTSQRHDFSLSHPDEMGRSIIINPNEIKKALMNKGGKYLWNWVETRSRFPSFGGCFRPVQKLIAAN
jgi:hypothetical protein